MKGPPAGLGTNSNFFWKTVSYSLNNGNVRICDATS